MAPYPAREYQPQNQRPLQYHGTCARGHADCLSHQVDPPNQASAASAISDKTPWHMDMSVRSSVPRPCPGEFVASRRSPSRLFIAPDHRFPGGGAGGEGRGRGWHGWRPSCAGEGRICTGRFFATQSRYQSRRSSRRAHRYFWQREVLGIGHAALRSHPQRPPLPPSSPKITCACASTSLVRAPAVLLRRAAPRRTMRSLPTIGCRLGAPEEEVGAKDGRAGGRVMPGRGGFATGGSSHTIASPRPSVAATSV